MSNLGGRKVKQITVESFKDWLKEEDLKSKKYRVLRFLSVADYYRVLTGKNPRYKNPNRHVFDYNKPFRNWVKNIWKPFLKEHYEELEITNIVLSRYGQPLFFKPKESR